MWSGQTKCDFPPSLTSECVYCPSRRIMVIQTLCVYTRWILWYVGYNYFWTVHVLTVRECGHCRPNKNTCQAHKCLATSSRVTPRGGRRHVTLRRIHTTNLYMYMFCLTFPLLKQCESTVRRDVTGSYIGNGARATRK